MSSPSQMQEDEGDSGAGKDQILWEEIEETPIEVDEFDQLFSRPIVQPKAKKNKKEVAETKKVTVAKYLDAKRGQDVGIFIRSNKLDIDEVKNAIYNFDNSIIDFEVLSEVEKKAATPQELELLNGHVDSQTDVPLNGDEQFLLDLSKISHFNQRLRCIMFQARFAEGMADIENRLNNVSHVCDQLLNSMTMKQVKKTFLLSINMVILYYIHLLFHRS